MTAMDAEAKALRLTGSTGRLILAAIGGPRQMAGKLRRFLRTLRLWVDRSEFDRRLETLEARGFFSTRPDRVQILFGSLDMLRFVIEPASRDYYRQQGIGFGFHQLLRLLDDPVSMIDPTGFFSDRDTIIGHVMQVVHLNPIYDMQLLGMFPDGLAQMERQTQAMVEGTHPRVGTIGAIVEDPGYHARLLDYVRRYRRDSATSPIVRAQQTLRGDAHYDAAERTFATLPGFIDYCNRLPQGVGTLLRRHRRTRRFPLELASEPASKRP